MLQVKGISQLDLDGWKASPIAEAVFKAIRDKQRELEREAGRGMDIDKANSDLTLANACERKGRWQSLDDVLNMSAAT